MADVVLPASEIKPHEEQEGFVPRFIQGQFRTVTRRKIAFFGLALKKDTVDIPKAHSLRIAAV